MRIIAGEHRGRRLLGPTDEKTTRPITDRVKTSLFDHLAAAGRIEDAAVLDLFSGTGSLGLECLSRGAGSVTFVERDRVALERLRRNIEMIGVDVRARVLPIDALSAGLIDALDVRHYSLIFFDPPYRMSGEPRVARQIQRLATVADDEAWLIYRTAKDAAPPSVAGWAEPTTRVYGTMALHEYRR